MTFLATGFLTFRFLTLSSSLCAGLDQQRYSCLLLSKGTRWVLRGPWMHKRRSGDWWQKERAGLIALWQRDPVQTRLCRLAREAQLVRKTVLLSITQHLSVLTVFSEIVCTHENDTHVHKCMNVFMLGPCVTRTLSWLDGSGGSRRAADKSVCTTAVSNVEAQLLSRAHRINKHTPRADG